MFGCRCFPCSLVVRYTDLGDIPLIEREKVSEEEGRRLRYCCPSLDRPFSYKDMLLSLCNTSFCQREN